MSKFIIIGNVHDSKYFLNVKTVATMYAPEFHWNGLIQNATVFTNRDEADRMRNTVNPYTKLEMYVVPAENYL